MTLEEMQQALLDLQESQKLINAENEGLKTQLLEKVQREKELEEHNQKLFLKVTSTIEKETIEKETPSFIDDATFKSLNKNELKLLKDVIEEE